MFSLHAQGWPVIRTVELRPATVLPARAGMARSCVLYLAVGGSSPCTRRDGPCDRTSRVDRKTFSLHAQGWPGVCIATDTTTLVLPARAGMARAGGNTCGYVTRSPCTRRDGPKGLLRHHYLTKFSLHAQGWPDLPRGVKGLPGVLPARAGMARSCVLYLAVGGSSPCTRRDGPSSDYSKTRCKQFSLHAQGWPDDPEELLDDDIVLPARAGMAPPVQQSPAA